MVAYDTADTAPLAGAVSIDMNECQMSTIHHFCSEMLGDMADGQLRGYSSKA